ncbi:MAG TPA: c-type cytochrome [Planctomycetota bacterium]
MTLVLLLLQAWSEVEVPPAPAGLERLAEAGERIFGWHCLPCHGPEGKGDGPHAARLGLRPRDLTRGLFKLKTSPPGQGPFDDDLYRTITAGLPVRYMPAFREPLGPEDRWAVVAFVRTLSRDDPPRARVEAPAGTPDVLRGAGLYRDGCAACHGRGFDGPIPDLGRGEVEFLGGARVTDVYRVLTTGLEGSAMPSFASLPANDRRDLAAFVTTLYRPVPAGERLFFGKGCVACHTIGKGRHLGPDLAGVGTRRTSAWLAGWLRSPERMAATDPDARRLLAEYKIAMPEPNLAEGEVGALAGYLSGLR